MMEFSQRCLLMMSFFGKIGVVIAIVMSVFHGGTSATQTTQSQANNPSSQWSIYSQDQDVTWAAAESWCMNHSSILPVFYDSSAWYSAQDFLYANYFGGGSSTGSVGLWVGAVKEGGNWWWYDGRTVTSQINDWFGAPPPSAINEYSSCLVLYLSLSSGDQWNVVWISDWCDKTISLSSYPILCGAMPVLTTLQPFSKVNPIVALTSTKEQNSQQQQPLAYLSVSATSSLQTTYTTHSSSATNLAIGLGVGLGVGLLLLNSVLIALLLLYRQKKKKRSPKVQNALENPPSTIRSTSSKDRSSSTDAKSSTRGKHSRSTTQGRNAGSSTRGRTSSGMSTASFTAISLPEQSSIALPLSETTSKRSNNFSTSLNGRQAPTFDYSFGRKPMPRSSGNNLAVPTYSNTPRPYTNNLSFVSKKDEQNNSHSYGQGRPAATRPSLYFPSVQSSVDI